MTRRAILALVIIVALALTAGCAQKYTFDFKREKDAVNSEGAWDASDGIEYMDLGAYIEDGSLVSPFRFKGDFSVEVSFFVNIRTEHYLQWLEFYLVDSNDFDYFTHIGLGMQMKSPASAEYWVGQRDSMIGSSTAMPGLELDGNNKLMIMKTGDLISIRLNDYDYQQFTILEANRLADYNFYISGYDDYNTEHKGIYLQKFVVSYESGNRIAVATL